MLQVMASARALPQIQIPELIRTPQSASSNSSMMHDVAAAVAWPPALMVSRQAMASSSHALLSRAEGPVLTRLLLAQVLLGLLSAALLAALWLRRKRGILIVDFQVFRCGPCRWLSFRVKGSAQLSTVTPLVGCSKLLASPCLQALLQERPC